jgi:hypothetical protein
MGVAVAVGAVAAGAAGAAAVVGVAVGSSDEHAATAKSATTPSKASDTGLRICIMKGSPSSSRITQRGWPASGNVAPMAHRHRIGNAHVGFTLMAITCQQGFEAVTHGRSSCLTPTTKTCPGEALQS